MSEDTCVALNFPLSTSRKRKHLRDKINKLSATEHEEIFKIMQNHSIEFTQNKNGTFFDISKISEDVLVSVEQFVDFCINNRKELDEYDKKINECKLNNNYDKLQRTSVPLQNAITSEDKKEDWQALFNEVKTSEKVNAFINLLENNNDRLNIKKTNTKFINTKKKYAKKNVSDKKGDNELPNVLEKEYYIST